MNKELQTVVQKYTQNIVNFVNSQSTHAHVFCKKEISLLLLKQSGDDERDDDDDDDEQ